MNKKEIDRKKLEYKFKGILNIHPINTINVEMTEILDGVLWEPITGPMVAEIRTKVKKYFSGKEYEYGIKEYNLSFDPLIIRVDFLFHKRGINYCYGG